MRLARRSTTAAATSRPRPLPAASRTAVAQVLDLQARAGAVAEALECLGGNGYVEESIMPRLYREAPLNSIWEGSGNVNALDVLRAMEREPESVSSFHRRGRRGAWI